MCFFFGLPSLGLTFCFIEHLDSRKWWIHYKDVQSENSLHMFSPPTATNCRFASNNLFKVHFGLIASPFFPLRTLGEYPSLPLHVRVSCRSAWFGQLHGWQKVHKKYYQLLDDSFSKQKSHVLFFPRDDSNHEVMFSDGTAGHFCIYPGSPKAIK